LTEAQLTQYREEGWCTTGRLFDPEECDAILAEFDVQQQRLMLGESADGALAYQPMLFANSPLLTRTLADPRIVEMMLQLVGPNVRMYWEQLVAKPPHAHTELPWHQDDGYAPTDPPGYATCWLALDDATEDNGCMHVIPRSHKLGILKHRMANATFRTGIDAYEDGVDPVAAPLRKGCALLFNSLTLHHSGPNTTDIYRRAWILQYCDAAARHGNTGDALDDRVWVASEGEIVKEPWSERPIDVAGVFANWTPVD
jgi:ectoine hydroxylase-related dioxygenase (phytanoyl-CoA dioxygenase family)